MDRVEIEGRQTVEPFAGSELGEAHVHHHYARAKPHHKAQAGSDTHVAVQQNHGA
jgi:hypothetical protein